MCTTCNERGLIIGIIMTWPLGKPPDHILTLIGLLLYVLPFTLSVGPDIQAKTSLVNRLLEDVFARKKLFPKEEEKTVIEMSLNIRYIDMDLSKGRFSMSGKMKLSWTDQRIGWDPTFYEDMEVVYLPFSKDWSPDVFLHNGLSDHFKQTKVGMLSYQGDINYEISVHSVSACTPNLNLAPWGLQICSLKFGSWINTQYEVEYRLPKKDQIVLEDFVGTGWKIVNTSGRLQSINNPLAKEPVHLVVFDMTFQRQDHYDPGKGIHMKPKINETENEL